MSEITTKKKGCLKEKELVWRLEWWVGGVFTLINSVPGVSCLTGGLFRLRSWKPPHSAPWRRSLFKKKKKIWCTITREQNNLNTLRFSWKCLWVSRAIKTRIWSSKENKKNPSHECCFTVLGLLLKFELLDQDARLLKILHILWPCKAAELAKINWVMWSHKSILPALRFWPNAQASDLLAATGCSLSVTTSESNENNNGSVSNSSLKEQQRRRTAGFSRWGKGVFALLSTGFCRKKSDLPTGLMLSCCGSDLVEVSRWQTLMRRLFVQSTASF